MRNKILIAEDSEFQRENLRRGLARLIESAKLDMKLLTAIDKDDALRVIEQQGNFLLLVISDMHMPRYGDGNVVARLALQKGAKVIFVTASPEEVEDDIRKNSLGVISKTEEFETQVDKLWGIILEVVPGNSKV